MRLSNQIKLREIHFRWIGILILSLIITFFVDRDDGHSHTPLEKLFIVTGITAFFWNGAFILFIYFRKKFPFVRQTPRRLVLTALALSGFLIVGDIVICMMLERRTLAKLIAEPSTIFLYTDVNFIAALFVGLIYENVYFFEQWKSTIQLNEALKNQQIRTQFEVLQNQMSPHFLFNSLNTLTTLIAEDQKIATEFTQKLSEVYRYILANKEKELVLLKDELEFAEAYLYLLKMRYPENLTASYAVDEQYLRQYIAPLTIQMLIENAIKHNVISKAHPLHIDVYVENGSSVVVKNNFQGKKGIEKSTKTGLANIRKRYEYFGNKNIDIITTAQNYLVAIPLISLVNENDQPVIVEL
ncbi:hypothetical protein C900_00874 [Fulvivirga imtechensis AK7]|uniref:Signal transduction histidine kinase internal region domain-containing protein n=1 Tax=Fulvivirga imtechensis AK7 TaxID=1237149 RepID=L8JXK3_9BACT|nr:histidine kinase [Fulvivirga imtechensis]ELR72913.1 hypothetical protein C900_00874 [Fulvivirga imtechensis AK7]